MPDKPSGPLARFRGSGGDERRFNTAFEQYFLFVFLGSLIIHECIQRYIIACNELNS